MRCRGAMLAEAMAALGIFAVVAAGLAGALYQEARTAREDGRRLKAWQAALGELERLEAGGLEALSTGREVRSGPHGAEGSCTVIVEEVAPGVRQFRVEVGWTGTDGGRRRVAVRTLGP